MKLLLSVLAAALIAPSTAAQSNKVAGRDATLRIVEDLRSFGREGVYPNGINGLANSVTVCNIGSGNINWQAAMNADHPMYAPLVIRVTDDRIEQISDWSYVKHGFASVNGSTCGACSTANWAVLGPNCSDTYGAGLNADQYYLGPPAEIDPWLGMWNPIGSHFDRGEPDVGLPQNQDGLRSLSRTQVGRMSPTQHRVIVRDQDLGVASARYYYGMYIVVRGEPGAVREDNWCFRQTRPVWSGSSWGFGNLSTPINGSPLQFWTGANVTSAGNLDAGLFYVAAKVTGPDAQGLWHYEYAIHNRDNQYGGAAFRLPICPTARVLNARFRDIDQDANNDWSVQVHHGEIACFAPASGNALEWNTIYNLSFAADVGPVPGSARIDEARPGSANMTVSIPTSVPGLQYTQYLGDGCGSPAPALSPTGMPPYATVPNQSFALRIDGAAPGGSVALLAAFQPAAVTIGSCTLYLDVASSFPHATANADAQGSVQIGLPIPADPSLEGFELSFQAAELVTGGVLLQALELSNGLRLRIGNQTSGCR